MNRKRGVSIAQSHCMNLCCKDPPCASHRAAVEAVRKTVCCRHARAGRSLASASGRLTPSQAAQPVSRVHARGEEHIVCETVCVVLSACERPLLICRPLPAQPFARDPLAALTRRDAAPTDRTTTDEIDIDTVRGQARTEARKREELARMRAYHVTHTLVMHPLRQDLR